MSGDLHDNMFKNNINIRYNMNIIYIIKSLLPILQKTNYITSSVLHVYVQDPYTLFIQNVSYFIFQQTLTSLYVYLIHYK